VAAGLAPLVVAAAVVSLVAQSSSGSPNTHPTTGGQRSAFAVLSSTQARAAVVSAQPLPAGIYTGMSRQLGRNPSEAVFTGGTYPTWVVPGSTEVCLVIGAIGHNGVPGWSCATSEQAESGKLTLTTETDSGAPVIFGLAPNDNSSVAVTNVSGTTQNVPVKTNVYEVTSGTPSTVSLKTASGEAVIDSVKLPPKPSGTAPAPGSSE
jgi:hypothetical protein